MKLKDIEYYVDSVSVVKRYIITGKRAYNP
jgi:hypothetical protein